MFSFFKKKKFLVDSIAGITDFHNHLLPGIDDGAGTVEDSIIMIEKFKELGIENFIHTPHIISDYYPNNRATIEEAFTKLYSEYDNQTSNSYSAEYMMDQQFLEILSQNEIIPLFKKYLLVEMSYFQPPINLKEILFKIQNHSYKPILAHPERYAYYQSSDLGKYKELKNLGCSFQLNLLSLTPHYGIPVQKIALKLLENDMIDFISTDTHRIDHLLKLEKITLQQKQLELIKKVIDNNHKKISLN
ncbi:CpsB/CapC family capsule biosynthesis tyrosine phosphatase [Gramella sp. AN32]|uniref:protein-tyrosine-phosphatase n=1 Tax=Christiangramia antarctica TaxID=2058158 RepID=A0ABW5X0U8_9FLAO|nr:CpsB/CapC family capsule biosynthesis tyrosine phosphatase [Gramella sp. AN32]MCM4157094.1 histidinol phosphatase [Gramella sp. AN32]